jgi:hypothetical protein
MGTEGNNTPTETASAGASNGEASANLSVGGLAAMLKERRNSAAAAVAGSSRAGEAGAEGGGETGEVAAETETGAATADAATDVAAENNGDPSSDNSQAQEGEEGAGEEGDGTEGNEGNEEGAEEGREVPKAIRSLQKRVSDLTRRAKQAEEAAAEAKAQLEEAASAANKPSAVSANGEFDPINLHPQVAQVSEALRGEQVKLDAAKSWLKQLASNPDVALEKLAAGGLNFDSAESAVEQLTELKESAFAEYTALRSELRGARNQVTAMHEEVRRAADAEASAAHPWIADKNHALTKMMEATFKEMPILKKMPAARMFIADALAHRAQRQAAKAAAANGNGNGKPKAPVTIAKPGAGKPGVVLPTTRGAAAPKVDARKAAAAGAVTKAEEEFKGANGRVRDLPALLRARREASLAGRG